MTPAKYSVTKFAKINGRSARGVARMIAVISSSLRFRLLTSKTTVAM